MEITTVTVQDFQILLEHMQNVTAVILRDEEIMTNFYLLTSAFLGFIAGNGS